MENNGHVPLSDRLHTIDQKLDKLTDSLNSVSVSMAVDPLRHASHEHRLNKLESISDWSIRLVIGGVIMAVLALVFV